MFDVFEAAVGQPIDRIEINRNEVRGREERYQRHVLTIILVVFSLFASSKMMMKGTGAMSM